ncbi:MAG: CCA tRNA nucleotidyltransferase [Thermoanaerobaculia bacterium]
MKIEFEENLISRRALEALSILREKGFDAYFVGGAVRDLLLGIAPRDFDIATSATPFQIKNLIPSSKIIGKRFKLVQIQGKKEKIEISTFRRDPGEPPENLSLIEKMRWKNRFYGSIKEDALRRDFTINSLYLDPIKKEIIDFTSGLEDLKNKILRVIGDPYERFMEDPVRMIRVCALSCRLNFKIEEGAEKYIEILKNEILLIPKARIGEEILRILKSGAVLKTFEFLERKGILKLIMPFSYNFSKKFIEALRIIEKFSQSFKDEELFIFLFFSLNFESLRGRGFNNLIEKDSFLYRKNFFENLKFYYDITLKIFLSKKKNLNFLKSKRFLRVLKFASKLSFVFPEYKKNVRDWKTFYYKYRKN